MLGIVITNYQLHPLGGKNCASVDDIKDCNNNPSIFSYVSAAASLCVGGSGGGVMVACFISDLGSSIVIC